MEIKQIVVLVTAPSTDVAETISNALLEQELVACANIIPSIHSIYKWKEEIRNDQEVLIIFKTRNDLFDDAFINVVKKHHPYEVPEIIALPIVHGSSDYLEWINDVTKKR